MAEQITIVGDGAMGTVCALILSGNGHAVRMWSAFPEAVTNLRSTRENTRFLPGIRIPDAVEFTADDACFSGSTMVVSAVPTQFLRSVWNRLAAHLPADMSIISCTKGIEIETRLRPTQIIHSTLLGAGSKSAHLCALSGPNIAGEIAHQLPATAVAAAINPQLGLRVQAAFTNRYFRVYTNDDIIGVEISGAVKNIIALAAGMIDGLGLGCNAKAALLARGLVEITRLGTALGAQPATFAGLAGMGDLVTTCISPEGRNRSTGEQLGRGKKLEQILAERPSVVEGVPTTRAVMQLAREKGVEMPIVAAVHSILFENVTAADALERLMTRQTRPEHVS